MRRASLIVPGGSDRIDVEIAACPVYCGAQLVAGGVLNVKERGQCSQGIGVWAPVDSEINAEAPRLKRRTKTNQDSLCLLSR